MPFGFKRERGEAEIPLKPAQVNTAFERCGQQHRRIPALKVKKEFAGLFDLRALQKYGWNRGDFYTSSRKDRLSGRSLFFWR